MTIWRPIPGASGYEETTYYSPTSGVRRCKQCDQLNYRARKAIAT